MCIQGYVVACCGCVCGSGGGDRVGEGLRCLLGAVLQAQLCGAALAEGHQAGAPAWLHRLQPWKAFPQVNAHPAGNQWWGRTRRWVRSLLRVECARGGKLPNGGQKGFQQEGVPSDHTFVAGVSHLCVCVPVLQQCAPLAAEGLSKPCTASNQLWWAWQHSGQARPGRDCSSSPCSW
jgi:hypothetical protein